MEYYSSIKKNEIMPFAATWMDLEIIILSKSDRERSKSDRERQISYYSTYMWKLVKNDRNEFIFKTERLTETNLRLPKGKHGGKG